MKWTCKGHNCDVVGEPFFIKGEGQNEWEIDQSDMYCERLTDDQDWWNSLTDELQDSEMDKCEWEETN